MATLSQGLEALSERDRVALASATAETFMRSRDPRAGIRRRGSRSWVSSSGRPSTYPDCGWLRALRPDRYRDAIRYLAEGYADIGAEAQYSWRLFEQALFIAFQQRDRDAMREIRQLIVNQPLNEHQPVLCDVLELQLSRKYREAAELGESHSNYFSITSQAAFCWLVEGDVKRAVATLENGRYVSNEATNWLRGVLALCSGSEELYRESMSALVHREFFPEELQDRHFWVRTWTNRPQWLGIFPGFYFPCLPSELTGAPEDLWLSQAANRWQAYMDEIGLPKPLQFDGETAEASPGEGERERHVFWR